MESLLIGQLMILRVVTLYRWPVQVKDLQLSSVRSGTLCKALTSVSHSSSLNRRRRTDANPETSNTRGQLTISKSSTLHSAVTFPIGHDAIISFYNSEILHCNFTS